MKVISLFSGAGGMDLGFIKAGFEIVWANDFDLDASKTYAHNIGEHIIHGDITKIASDEIPYKKGEIDVVIGGFPCQGFSVANTKRSIEDERNFLYREMLRVIKDKEPKYFVAENVKGILSLHNGKVFELIKNDFKNLGYQLEAKLLNSADYGVPQQRERVIIIGNRIGKEITFPEPTYIHQDKFQGVGKAYISTKEVIKELYDVETVERNTDQVIKLNDKKIYNHISYTNVDSKFWGRKYNVSQADICDYLKEWRNKKGISTKKVDEHFGYKHTAGHWFRKDNKSGSIPKPSDWWKLKKLLGFCDKYDKQVTEFVEKEIKFEQSLRIANWDTSNVTNMVSMFNEATKFNQPLNNWNTSNVTNMGEMFYAASNFNQDLSSWCVFNIKEKPLFIYKGSIYFYFDGKTLISWTEDLKPQWGEPCPPQ